VGVGEAHVVLDEGEDLSGFIVGEAESAADFRSHGDADFNVAVEADAVGGATEGGRLADVVEESSPGQGDGAVGLQLIEKKKGVGEDVAFGVVLRGLFNTFHAGDFGEDLRKERGFIEEFEGAAGAAFGEHPGELVTDAFAADGVDAGSEGANGICGRGMEFEAEAGGETDGAEHAEVVFLKTLLGTADGADDAGAKVGEAADIIHEAVERRFF
jgi:hypothetical protein